MEQRQTQRIKTISEFHQLRGLPKPEHPLISIIDYTSVKRPLEIGEVNWIFDFYQISVKQGIDGSLNTASRNMILTLMKG